MQIEKIFLEQKGQTFFNVEITDFVIDAFVDKNNQPSNTLGLCNEEVIILPLDAIPPEYFPTRVYTNNVKNPKRIPIDLLVSFRHGDFVSEYIRFKQPDPNGKKKLKSDRINVTAPKISWEYVSKSEKQIKDWFKTKVEQGMSGFEDEREFLDWYEQNMQDGFCSYCGLRERDSQRLVHEGILQSLRFPTYGLFSSGVNRGYWLEIDRKNPIGLYSVTNCNPSCYFCNNDKSDVFNEEQYRAFQENRLGFLEGLLL
jgi:hypothetical protein